MKVIQLGKLKIEAPLSSDSVAVLRGNQVVRVSLESLIGGSGGIPDLATVATTGKYSDLLERPTLGDGLSESNFTLVEKQKLEGIAEGANNFSLPSASSGQVLKYGAQGWEAGTVENTTYTATNGIKLVGTSIEAVFGSTANTITQGNDPRLTNSREWTASVVTQSEAETGTATTARKWTAQRVRQNVTAHWNGVTSVWGRGLVNSSNAAAGRSALGLENVDNTSDVNKPISSATQSALDSKVNKETGKTLISSADLQKLSGIETGAQVNLISVDNLTSDSATRPLSAKQGKVLKSLIDSINSLLQSDDSTLDELQEIVDFIKLNREDLDSLGISSIAGLEDALSGKQPLSSILTGTTASFTTALKTKLDAIAAQATKNSTDAQLRDRATHTGTQAISTVSGLQTALDGKVDKVTGKGLSTEDFTTTEKSKLAGVATGATKNATDAQLRDRSTHTGTQAISTVSGLQTALDGKVDNTDSRLTDSREWTGATVSQAEAEAGTATTRRAWTAQRVRQAILAWWAGSTDKTKLDGIATGATKNATDAQLRDRSTHTGTQAISTVSGLQTALDGKVDNSDSRLTNSREWTASVVSQAEAEAGTATTARKWTAQRVRQAIQAWFLTISGTFGRTILERNTAAEVRSDLELGTAATRNVGTGSGNLMEVGAFGIGAVAPKSFSGSSYAAQLTKNLEVAMRPTGDAPIDTPESGATKAFAVGNIGAWETHLAFGAYNENFYIRSRASGGGNFRPWQKMFHTGNFDPDTKLDTTVFNARSITAGNGLSGGGTLAANRTITLGTPSTLTSSTTNAVTATSHTHEIVVTKADVGLSNVTNVAQAAAATQVIAGNGLTGGGTLAANRTVALGTPSEISGSSTNSVTSTSHTHALSEEVKASLAKADTALQNGAYGLGKNLPSKVLDANLIADEAGVSTGLYPYLSNSGSTNVPHTYVYIFHIFYSNAGNCTQIAYGYIKPRTWIRYRYSGVWSPWQEHLVPETLLDSTGNSSVYPMTQKATTDALATKANTTTQIIAGTGLTGGGTLAANRTLNVAYGTTAGTAAQGNDSRLSNAREWTASEVSQAEAEAGTATTARKWTSQRVRQNVSTYAYSKTQTDNLIAGATTGTKVWQNKANVTQLEVNVYHKMAFSSPRTLKLPLNPPENSFVELYATTGDLKSTIIDPNGKTLMDLSESMEIDRRVYGLRLEFLDNSWRVGM